MKSTNENKFDISKFTQENDIVKGGFSKALGGTSAGFAAAGSTNIGSCPTTTNSGNCVAGCGGTTTQPTTSTTIQS
ncbi:hypothetical protein [Chryseobacterium oranimense]|jgi:hypothetical protein|uniref:hypothetical protein n=1 Tax=Chryseobacterium oranimense TaxID=421058 RepID=UPI0031CE7D7D